MRKNLQKVLAYAPLLRLESSSLNPRSPGAGFRDQPFRGPNATCRRAGSVAYDIFTDHGTCRIENRADIKVFPFPMQEKFRLVEAKVEVRARYRCGTKRKCAGLRERYCFVKLSAPALIEAHSCPGSTWLTICHKVFRRLGFFGASCPTQAVIA